ncbi:MAG TPA: trypsin-like peptidase domain-containing protein [Bacteroidales bacterium]
MKNLYFDKQAIKKIFIQGIFCVLTITISAQIPCRTIKPGEKQKFGIRHTNKQIPKFETLAVNLRNLHKEDSIESLQGLPFRFGKDIDVSIDVIKNAITTQDGDTITYFYQIKSNGAYSVNLIFDKFVLAKDATFKMYNSDQTMLFGPVTAKQNPTNKIFWTDLVKGENIILEVSELISSKEKSILHISKIIHGYKDVFSKNFSGYGQSASCNRDKDIKCPIGNGWQNEANSVAMLLLANGTRFCTGSLVNNTSNDLRPYLLTAFHCLDSYPDGNLSNEEHNAVNNWVFRFLYQSSSCQGGDGSNYLTFNGAAFRAAYQPSDFALLELARPQDPNITYAGWTTSNTPATSGACIHHPNGDVKKISTYTNPLTNVYIITLWSTYPVFINCPANTHWDCNFNQGTVEPGASGSPLFDQNHRIVGQLHGNYLTQGDYCAEHRGQYGRFDVSWTGGGTPETQLRFWLDPCNTGASYTNTINNPTISGPTFVCSSGASFYISNLPAGLNVTWTSSSNLTTSNPNSVPCTFYAVGNEGNHGWVQATLSSTCGTAFTTTTQQFPVWVGPPSPVGIIGDYTVCPPYNEIRIYGYSAYAEGVSNYYWHTPSDAIAYDGIYDSQFLKLWFDMAYYYGTVEYGTKELILDYSNECANNRYTFYITIPDWCVNNTSYSLSPNPASDFVELTINNSQNSSIINSELLKSAKAAPNPIVSTYSIRILNTIGALVYSANMTANTFTIPVKNLQDGTYIVELNDGKKVYRKHLIIKH